MGYHKPLGDYSGKCGGCNNFEYRETEKRIERWGKCVLPNRANYHQASQKACRLYTSSATKEGDGGMLECEIKDGDIVEIDYIEEFTKEHRNEGKALVLWKGFNHQPLIMRLEGEYSPVWTCYEHISRVVGHISLGVILKSLCK